MKTLKRHGMTGWYDPGQLIQTGIRVASSTVFGRMFDRRELMSALDPFQQPDFDAYFDYSTATDDFWLDFCADTGDGWNPTYAVARLLARARLSVETTDGAHLDDLMQGRVLVFGGDQVYPTASKEYYDDKLRAPFDAANRLEAQTPRLKDRHVFAVPGNHDWYDGLTAFAALFCNRHPQRAGSLPSPGRWVAGRQTRQTRSYFALKLPHDWWLCAFDIQLDGYIDQAQLSFFEYVAQDLMNNGSNVILCVGQPVWAYCRDDVVPEFENYAFASLIATGVFKPVDRKDAKRHRLRLVLTGDAHHYAHYLEQQPASTEVIHHLTCGLGGTFLHPTHWLEDTSFDSEWHAPPPLATKCSGTFPSRKPKYPRHFTLKRDNDFADGKVVYPDVKTSARQTFKNFAFFWMNFRFSLFMGAVGLFVTWLLHFGSVVLNANLAGLLGEKPWADAITNLLYLFGLTPWPAMVIGGIVGALGYFADHKGILRFIIGGVHALVHVAIYCGALLVVSWLSAILWPNDGAIIITMAIVTAVLAPTIMGAYLYVALNWFKRHWNEAFSSLRIEHYKGFLRLKIDREGKLTVYPIVLDRVPRGETATLAPRLVEKPIELDGRPSQAVQSPV